MNKLNAILILLAVFLAVFLEASFTIPRRLLGAQIDLLPALVVYASLTEGLAVTTASAVFGGLLFDSLSANPVGISVLPLFAVGLIIHSQRDLILRGQTFAQATLGLGASAFVPAATLLLLLTKGQQPLLGWVSLWQWIVMSLAGAAATPLLFRLFDRLQQTFGYRHTTETSFRPDREIRRGRN
jgi:rod shape-determining protein MreD